MEKFFLEGKKGFPLARATFPSLTYPNISSILTAKRMGEQPVIANHVVVNGEVVNYESHVTHRALRESIDPQTVLGQMESEGRETASFSYIFAENASTHMLFGLKEGLEYKHEEYKKLDGRLIENMETFLSSREPNQWPEFIYIHIVGVDGVAHHHGAKSKEVIEHLAWLDARLNKTFRLLRSGEERGQRVESFLTADHGFVDTKFHIDAEKIIRDYDPSIVVTNESRFLGLHFTGKTKVAPLLKKIRKISGVELTVWRRNDHLELETKKKNLRFAYGPTRCQEARFTLAWLPSDSRIQPAGMNYSCPESFENAADFYPFLVPDLAAYLNAPNHPDALVIAKPNFSFTKDFLANHGGPTKDEMLVPLLTRNTMPIEENGGLVRTSDILRHLRK